MTLWMIFFVSLTIIEIRSVTQQFSAEWRCKGLHQLAHRHFTISKYHIYDTDIAAVNSIVDGHYYIGISVRLIQK